MFGIGLDEILIDGACSCSHFNSFLLDKDGGLYAVARAPGYDPRYRFHTDVTKLRSSENSETSTNGGRSFNER